MVPVSKNRYNAELHIRKELQLTKNKSGGRKGRGDGMINAPAPARIEIIEMLENSGKPLQRKDIIAALKVESDDSREILRRRLRAMVRDGQLIKTRRNAFGLPARMDLVKGRISAHRDGFGFVLPDDGGSDLYLSSREMRKVLHGDRVLAAVTGTDSRGRREGMIADVLERANDSIVGRYVEENGVALVVPDGSGQGDRFVRESGQAVSAADYAPRPPGRRRSSRSSRHTTPRSTTRPCCWSGCAEVSGTRRGNAHGSACYSPARERKQPGPAALRAGSRRRVRHRPVGAPAIDASRDPARPDALGAHRDVLHLESRGLGRGRAQPVGSEDAWPLLVRRGPR